MRWPTSATPCDANEPPAWPDLSSIWPVLHCRQPPSNGSNERSMIQATNDWPSRSYSSQSMAASCIIENVTRGLVVYPKTIEAALQAELPFMATEEILMAGVQAGGDRQILHEKIRLACVASAKLVKVDGQKNDLLDRLKADSAFAHLNFFEVMDAKKYIGTRCGTSFVVYSGLCAALSRTICKSADLMRRIAHLIVRKGDFFMFDLLHFAHEIAILNLFDNSCQIKKIQLRSLRCAVL